MSSHEYVSKLSPILLSGLRPTLNAAHLDTICFCDLRVEIDSANLTELNWTEPYPILKSKHILQHKPSTTNI